jgi:transposase
MTKTNMSKNPKSDKKKRKFTPEYKAQVVRMCREEGRNAAEVGRELGLARTVVSNWVKQASIDEKGGGTGPLTSEERAEYLALKRENKKLRQEREILRHATAFFAKESTT